MCTPLSIKAFSLFLLFIVTGCNFTGKLTRRYHSVNYKDLACEIKKFVAVNASVPEKEPGATPPVKTMFDLTPKGQAALITEINKREASNADMIARLKTDLGVAADRSLPDVIDFTRFNKRILSAVRKIPIQQGERIEKVIIKITVNDKNFVFLHCNKIVTEYMNVDLGKIAYSNTNSLELAGNLGGGSEVLVNSSGTDKMTYAPEDKTLGQDRTTTSGISSKSTANAGLAGKFNASRSMNEEVQLRQRLVALNAFVQGNDLMLYQEGISGIDLTGNILTDIVGEYLNNVRVEKVSTLNKLYTSGTPSSQTALEIKENFIHSPNITSDITATVKFEAVYRRIDKGDRTITESDDDVTIHHGSTFKQDCTGETFVLIPANTLRPNVWKVTYDAGGTRLPLHIVDGANAGGDMLFLSYSNANEFLRWLRAGVASGAVNLSNPLGARGHRLMLADNVTVPKPAQISSLRIELN